MLTINVNPDHLPDALDACTALVQFLAEAVTIPREAESFSDDAKDAMSMIFAAVTEAQAAISRRLAAPVHPVVTHDMLRFQDPAPMRAFQDEAGVLHRVEPTAAVTPITPAAAALAVQSDEAPVAASSPPAPRLTEPRPAAASRRRAA